MDFMIEQAEERVARERDLRLGTVSASVTGTGCEDCTDCGQVISAKRRAAAPFARRCITCQENFERGQR